MAEHPDQWARLKEVFAEVSEFDPDRRSEYVAALRLSDPALADEIEALLDSDAPSEKLFGKTASSLIEPSFLGNSVGSYVLVREIGRGGMGTVYEGLRGDGEFEKQVAIKLTHRSIFSDDLIRRFRLERQILARLEHPNIVRLLDGGITSNGIPYFVMEFIDGETLRSFCARRKTGLDERLRLFLQICAAVAFAHRNLVIHRDLKPSNVLVTGDGTVKLLDFGIAKLLDDDNETPTRNTPLTPEYASPEQLRGEHVTTATDVFSLGVLLFELLTDRTPNDIYGVDRADILRAVLDSDPFPPSSLRSQPNRRDAETRDDSVENEKEPRETVNPHFDLKGDLDNIVLKCLRKNPAERYSSVEHLAEDINAFLNGMPVQAHPPSISYRMLKFVSRNRGAIAATAFVFTIIFAAMTFAVSQFLAAREQRRVAEHNFNQVRKIANALVLDYHDEIAKLDGSTKLREKLVADALEYLNAISSQSPTDPQLLMEMGIAFRKIGDVLGQPYAENLGRSTDAESNYSRAAELLENAASLDPLSAEIKYELAESYQKLIVARNVSVERREAIYQKLDALLKDLGVFSDLEPSKAAKILMIRADLITFSKHDEPTIIGKYENLLADGENFRRRRPEAVPIISALRLIAERLANQARLYAVVLSKRGDQSAAAGFFEESIRIARKSLELMNLQETLDRENARNRRRAFVANLNLSTSLLCGGKPDDALGFLETARAKMLEGRLADPDNRENLIDEIEVKKNDLLLAILRKDSAAANDLAMRGFEKTGALLKADPTNQELMNFRSFFGETILRLAENQPNGATAARVRTEMDLLTQEYKKITGANLVLNTLPHCW